MSSSDTTIIVLDPDLREGKTIAGWLRAAGLGTVNAVRTADEAIFLLGRRRPELLIIDNRVPATGEQRLLRWILDECGTRPPLVRAVGEATADPLAIGRTTATEVLHRPLDMHEVVLRVGTALQRPDLLRHLDRSRDESTGHLASARRMQLGLLPSDDELVQAEEECHVGVAGLYRAGEAVGGDFWRVHRSGQGGLVVALADFAGHGLSAALNTFRLHAILTDADLPHDAPVEMTALLNNRLNALLPRGHYATMVYAHLDPATCQIAWCSAGHPPPLFVSTGERVDLVGRGLPLGVRRNVTYDRYQRRLPGPGILCLFSDGLTESGANAPDVSREAMAEVLAGPARMAAAGDLTQAAREAKASLRELRDRCPCPGHSDDVMAVCIGIGEPSAF